MDVKETGRGGGIFLSWSHLVIFTGLSLCCLFHSEPPLLSWHFSAGWDQKHPMKFYFLSSTCRGSLQSVCVCEVLRRLWRCRRSERLYLITEDTEGNKSCLSRSRALHISCWKCPQNKHSGQQDLPHCCSAVTQLLSTPFARCGKPFIFTIMSDLGADGRCRASCGL